MAEQEPKPNYTGWWIFLFVVMTYFITDAAVRVA